MQFWLAVLQLIHSAGCQALSATATASRHDDNNDSNSNSYKIRNAKDDDDDDDDMLSILTTITALITNPTKD